jgi:hypothetical protein
MLEAERAAHQAAAAAREAAATGKANKGKTRGARVPLRVLDAAARLLSHKYGHHATMAGEYARSHVCMALINRSQGRRPLGAVPPTGLFRMVSSGLRMLTWCSQVEDRALDAGDEAMGNMPMAELFGLDTAVATSTAKGGAPSQAKGATAEEMVRRSALPECSSR